MALEPGSRLGPYEIVSLRGKGGMGEVYLARDVRLERKVAIKVLPRELAEDPLLRQRLQREARTISQLRHPHLCALYDIGAEDGVDFLVMEYLEGETLEDRLSRGALPIDEVIAIGGQIAEAVAAAHRGGVIHRDLKPGNVMLTRDGAKVLDFGLAKGVEARAAGAGSQAPTVTQSLTTAGSLLGTLLYMAPEQLEGKEADARSDLWALGAVLYQMVTGARPFTGASHANVMAAIMTGRPRAVSELRPEAPARLEWLIERCLEKSPDRRWQSAGDLALELGSLADLSDAPPPLPSTTGGSRRRFIVLALGGAVALLAGLGIGRTLSFRAGGGAGVKEPEHWTTMLLSSADLPKSALGHFYLPRDGRSVVMEGLEDGEPRFYRRPLDSLQTLPVALPPGQRPQVDSPDGRLMAIVDARRTLRTMPSEGGEPGSALAEGVNVAGVWGEDGFIYYQGEPAGSAGSSGFESLITWRVSVAGGEPKPLGPGFPTDLLPGERIVLTTVVRNNPPDYWGTVMAVDVATGASRFLVTGNNARYLDPGFLVFCRNRALWAAPIDSATGELSAPARSIEDVAATDGFYDFCRFDVSRSGNLVFEARREVGLGRLVWVARDGTVEPVAEEVKAFSVPIPSLDGRQVSVSVQVPGAGSEQWILDLSSGAWSRPAQSGPTGAMSWVPPDGREVVFVSDRGGGRGQVFLQPADHSAPAERLWPSEQPQAYLDISSDGQQVILIAFGTQGFVVLDRRSGKVRSVIEDGTVYAADFHPDSDWIVYARIDAKGSSNLWLVPFPGPGEPRQVTFDGGEDPRWSLAADEIYYRGPTHVMALPVEKSGAALATGRPRPLFEDQFRHHALRGILNYRPHPNGRLLMIENVESKPSLVLVLNWQAKVAQAFAPGGGG